MKIPERIVMVDALRGYALMGLFLIHLAEYYELYWYAPVPDPINTWMFNIFGGKAYAIFAMLFGLSFYLILQRNADRGTDFRLRFLWRLSLLLGLGYLHGLVYGGDILQVLAIAGLVLVPLWIAPSWLILMIASGLLLQITTYVFIVVVGHSELPYTHAFFSILDKPVLESYAHGSFLDVLSVNAGQGTLAKWTFMLETGRFASILGLGMLGFLAGRSGFFVDVARFGKWYLRLLVVSILGALACHFGASIFKLIPHAAKMNGALSNLLETYFNLFLTFVSVLVFVLLYQKKAAQRILVLLAPTGRMTLSFYVGQSMVCVPLFYNFGLAAYKYIGQFWSLMLGIVLWVIQVVIAHWWLKRFHYGPLEWCWRAATYCTTDIAFQRRHSTTSNAS